MIPGFGPITGGAGGIGGDTSRSESGDAYSGGGSHSLNIGGGLFGGVSRRDKPYVYIAIAAIVVVFLLRKK